jgi:MerR family transcriptional regulator, heat shock protein HspR
MTTNEPETYTIEEAGRTLGVPAADIEAYLAEGLVEARRSPAGEPYFSRIEMRRLWSIVTLTRDLGINLAGVGAILQLREQYERIHRDLVTLVEIMERELGPDVWDRLWPEDRPRPSSHVSVDGITDLEEGGAGPGGKP